MNSEPSLSVILVEDEPELRENLLLGLSAHGFEMRGVSCGSELNEALELRPAHIVLLDLGLPGEDGLAIAARLEGNPLLGIIMLTARGMTKDRVLGLKSGADNYFVKPVNIAELAVAIRNLGRRLPRPGWRFCAEESRLHTPNNVSVPLTAQECLLLEPLFARRGQAVPRVEIFASLGHPDDIYANARVVVLISRLRSKVLKADPAAPLPLRSCHSKSYQILAEDP
jgi:DNA-binding response OmpR family regulator